MQNMGDSMVIGRMIRRSNLGIFLYCFTALAMTMKKIISQKFGGERGIRTLDTAYRRMPV
jgi:hypothetical protein